MLCFEPPRPWDALSWVSEWRRCIPELTETVPAESKPAEFEPVETQTPPPLVSDKSDKPFIIPEFETMEPGVTMPVGWSEEQGGTEAITIAESVFEHSIEIHPSPKVGGLLVEAATPNPGSTTQLSAPASLQLTHDRESPILESSTPVFEPEEPEVIPPPQVVQSRTPHQLHTVPQSQQSTQQFQPLTKSRPVTKRSLLNL